MEQRFVYLNENIPSLKNINQKSSISEVTLHKFKDIIRGTYYINLGQHISHKLSGLPSKLEDFTDKHIDLLVASFPKLRTYDLEELRHLEKELAKQGNYRNSSIQLSKEFIVKYVNQHY